MAADAALLGLAFAAGLVSFLSPCVLPLVPAYLAYLTGQAGRSPTAPAGDGGGGATVAQKPGLRAQAARSGVAFVIGLSLVFIPAFYLLRALFTPVREVFVPVAGVLVIAMAIGLGLQGAGKLALPFLNREYRLMDRMPAGAGSLGAFLLGVGFAAGWTPCIGATLGAVISSAINNGASALGLLQMVAYALGLGVPFLALALAIDRARPIVRALGRRRQLINLASTGVLLVMGALLLTDNLLALTNLFARVIPLVPFGL